MITRPTTVQESAIRAAIDNGRVVDAARYTARTIDIMIRNGWVTTTEDGYRITPQAAVVVGQITLADVYRRDDRKDDPQVVDQRRVATLANTLGIQAMPDDDGSGVWVTVDDLATLLDAYQRDGLRTVA